MSRSSRKPRAKWLGATGPKRFLWPDAETGPFLVRLHWADVEGEARLVGVDLRSFEEGTRRDPPVPVRRCGMVSGVAVPSHPGMTADGDHRLWQQEGEEAFRAQRAVPDPLRRITVDDWRKLSFRAIDNQRRDDLTEAELLADWHRYFGRQDPAAKHDHDADVLKARMVRRRRGLPDEHYQAVAEVIKKARARGERQVLNVVMAEFSRTPEFPQVSRDMANNWRRQAQKRGYLPPPTSRD